VWGKLKGHAKPSDPPIPQALRFPVKYWTATEAKKWLKDNKVKYVRFEPAAEKTETKSQNKGLDGWEAAFRGIELQRGD